MITWVGGLFEGDLLTGSRIGDYLRGLFGEGQFKDLRYLMLSTVVVAFQELFCSVSF